MLNSTVVNNSELSLYQALIKQTLGPYKLYFSTAANSNMCTSEEIYCIAYYLVILPSFSKLICSVILDFSHQHVKFPHMAH